LLRSVSEKNIKTAKLVEKEQLEQFLLYLRGSKLELGDVLVLDKVLSGGELTEETAAVVHSCLITHSNLLPSLMEVDVPALKPLRVALLLVFWRLYSLHKELCSVQLLPYIMGLYEVQ